MNRRTITVIAIAMLVLAALILLLADRKSTLGRGQADFALEDPSGIDRILIGNKEYQIVLDRNNGVWQLNGKYAARQETVKLFLQALGRLEMISPASKSVRDTITALLDDAGTRLTLYRGDRAVKTFILVYENRSIPGTYMMDSRKRQPFRVGLTGFKGNDITGLFSVKEADWKDNVLFACRPEDIAGVGIEYPLQRERSFSISRDEKGMLRLAAAGKDTRPDVADQSALVDYFSYFGPVHYSLPEGYSYDTAWFREPFAIVRVTDRRQGEFRIRAYKIPADGGENYDMNNFLAFINNDTLPVLLKYTDTDPIMKSYPDFLKK